MNLNEKDDGRRNGKPECFYCGNLTAHKADCAIPCKSVVVKMTIEYIVSVPRFWGEDMIEFQRNDGSWCASNDLQGLAEYTDIDNNECGCRDSKFKFIREATKADHENMIDLTAVKNESV